MFIKNGTASNSITGIGRRYRAQILLLFRETYIEYWIASTAEFEGKKSLTATSLFSFFLSVQVC
jgi:hypothetical protein